MVRLEDGKAVGCAVNGCVIVGYVVGCVVGEMIVGVLDIECAFRLVGMCFWCELVEGGKGTTRWVVRSGVVVDG